MSPTTSNDLFTAASRGKYRFDTSRGSLTADDLWELDLRSLDNIALSLDAQLQQAGRKSFIPADRTKASAAAVLGNKLEIVKFVINTKVDEADEAKTRAAARQQKTFLKGLLEQKKLQQLESLSAEDIEKQIAALGTED